MLEFWLNWFGEWGTVLKLEVSLESFHSVHGIRSDEHRNGGEIIYPLQQYAKHENQYR